MENKKVVESKLYRWYNKFNYDTLLDNINWEGFDYYNYTNSFDFAKEHWNIIIEYDVLGESLDIIEEDINQRLINPIDYDVKINNNGADWYRWYVSKWKHYNLSWNVYHYRVNKKQLKIKKIYFVSKDIKENVSNLSLINRQYVWYNQETFSKHIWVYRSKISEYGNKYRLPGIETIWELGKFLPVTQNISMKNSNLLIQPL